LFSKPYIAEEKDRVFSEKKKYKAEEIPFATQLFTPDWIVRYMVQNALGRYWVEAHPEHKELTNDWEFYLEHEEDFQEKIAPYVNKELNVEDIKCLDPAMGSGHILVYMFDVLYEIYSKCGYMEREIPRLIIENNLFGLDIDDRAYQLACFSVVMKALEYNRRFLRSIERDGLNLNLASIQETNGWTDDDIEYLVGESNGEKFDSIKSFVDQYVNAKTFGSLIKVVDTDITYLKKRLCEIKSTPVDDIFQIEKRERVLSLIPKLLKQTKIMVQQYNVVILNPPYMGSGNMNKELSEFLKTNYPDSKSDLFAAFMEIDYYLKPNGFYAAINQHSWMFLSSYEKLREKIIENKFIDTMLHLGPRAFEEIGGEVVQSTTFVLRNTESLKKKGIYVRLINEKTASEKREKAIESVVKKLLNYYYLFDQGNFSKIPGSPIAYWVSEQFINNFTDCKNVDELSTAMVSGNKTAKNEKYLRFIWEVSNTKINKKWVPYAKGGEFRKWYGNIENVIDWSDEAKDFYRENSSSNIIKEEYWFKKGLTYTDLTSKDFSCRLLKNDMLFDMSGPGIIFENENLYYIMGILNSKVANEYFKTLNTTFHYKLNDVNRIPIIINEQKRPTVEKLVEDNITISQDDWDSLETSIDFKAHPLIKYKKDSNKLEDAFRNWEDFTNNQFMRLKSNEEYLNRIFIEIYGLNQEISSEIDDSDVTLRRANLQNDIKSFISYAIGCSFGRYSLDEDGLVYAGGDFDASRYKTFPADKDNILPILPGAYFEDDIVSRFVDFVRVTFGEDTLRGNCDV
ncbi:BREX-1 system adenine-specific DNA-methyltransferase PglX, partial [Heyndrickxia coagulans]|uniref:BREX-1 system adenine-specific DNA-methyltransferase PglX n=1 Tax=Heyndrickxia coagulans TaxID=1398 RepID=UPI002E1B7116|nr:BREX-1 system adenine-specific DNA-methyltransferase PglX [Heyndrickxia coagulans]